MGGAVLSKSLIQLSVDGRGCVPALLFDLRTNYGGGDEDNVTSCRRSPARTAALSALSPAATADPRVHQRPLDTPGQVWGSLSWGHCSFLLGPGAHKVLLVLM